MTFLADRTYIPRQPNLKTVPVVPRYPGSKRRHALRYLRTRSPEVVVEPFLGAGYFSLLSNSSIKYVAERDTGLRSLWKLWAAGYTKGIVENVKDIRAWSWVQDPESCWNRLKAEWENPKAPPWNAAVALSLRKLSQNGIVRCNKSGGLNIKYVASQIPVFLRYTPTFPPVVGEWHIFSDAWKCIREYNRSGLDGAAAALIDPPYYKPWEGGRRGIGSMTPCYADHKPMAEDTLRLMTGAITELGNNPFIEWMVATNYYSAELDTAVKAAVDKVWYMPRRIVSTVDNGTLDSMNAKVNDRKGRVSKTKKNREIEYWIE